MSTASYLQFALALIFVIGLILALGWLARRAGMGMPILAKGRRRRLAIVEMLPVDPRRRLVLVRRDGVEHLLLIGGVTDLCVERGIPAPQFSLEEAPQ